MAKDLIHIYIYIYIHTHIYIYIYILGGTTCTSLLVPRRRTCSLRFSMFHQSFCEYSLLISSKRKNLGSHMLEQGVGQGQPGRPDQTTTTTMFPPSRRFVFSTFPGALPRNIFYVSRRPPPGRFLRFPAPSPGTFSTFPGALPRDVFYVSRRGP